MLANARAREPAAPTPDVTAPIYLDHRSTTPVDPRVPGAMLPFLLFDALARGLDGLALNGHLEERLAGNLR